MPESLHRHESAQEVLRARQMLHIPQPPTRRIAHTLQVPALTRHPVWRYNTPSDPYKISSNSKSTCASLTRIYESGCQCDYTKLYNSEKKNLLTL